MRADGHLFPLTRVQPDRQIDPITVVIRPTYHDREILFLDRAILELQRQAPMYVVILGDHDHALVSRSSRCTTPGRVDHPRAELVEMKLQRRGQRAGPVPLGRMHDHARRLVNHRQPLVLIKDFEGYLFRLRRRGAADRSVPRTICSPTRSGYAAFTRSPSTVTLLALISRRTVNAAIAGQLLRQKCVQPFAGRRIWGDNFAAFRP